MKITIRYEGEIYDSEWFDKTNFEEVKIHAAVGFIFDDKGKLCLVKVNKKQGWTLPGGGVEDYDKTPEETFIRETNEEADLDLKDITRLGYWRSFPRSNPKNVDYVGRFAARVAKVKPLTLDPAEGVIPERKFINPKDFDKYIPWGKNGAFQLKKAMNALGLLRK